MPEVTRLSAVTLKVSSMEQSLTFYRDVLRLHLLYGDNASSFSSFDAGGGSFINLQLLLPTEGVQTGWGRVILYCNDVDEMHAWLKLKGYDPPAPEDAQWGERFFHIKDPDGHEISLAKRLDLS